MRIEKINDNKIKVMINREEAKAWNVTFKSIAQNTPQVQEMFWTAIRLAEKNVDFSVNGAKLFVEAVKDETGDEENCGFGMLITRVCSEADLKAAVSNCTYKGRLKHRELRADSIAESGKYIYRFRDFETVCRAVMESCEAYSGQSVLYKCDGYFYLYLIPENQGLFADMDGQLLEFGARVKNGQYMHGRLNEYGQKMIAANAVGVMKEYFCVQ